MGITKVPTDTEAIHDEADKIDVAAADGLLGVADSVAYRVADVERHLLNWERWMGLAAVPVGETHRADSITDNPDPFQADAGNDDWGAWLQILGSSDTPVIAGNVASLPEHHSSGARRHVFHADRFWRKRCGSSGG
jgi:hypothetical protein